MEDKQEDDVFNNVESKKLSNKAHYRHRAQSIIQFQSLDQLEDEVSQGYYETTPPRKGSRKRVIAIELIYGIYWWVCFNNFSNLLHKDSPLLLWQQFFIIIALLCIVFSFACVGVLHQICSAPFGLLCLRILTLTLLVYNLFSEPVWLLFIGVLGGGACILAITFGLWNLSLLDRYRKIHCHLLAFVSLQIIHFKFTEPFSLSSHWTQAFLLITPLITGASYIQDYRTPLVTRNDLLSNSKKVNYSSGEESWKEWVWLGVGFGCHLFISWSIFGGSDGELIKWMDLHSSIATKVLLVAVLCVGVLLGNDNNILLITSPQWLIMSLLTCIGFIYSTTASVTIIGALITGLYLMSIWPQLYYRLSEGVAYIVFPIAIATYMTSLMISQVSVGRVGFHGYCILFSLALQWYGLKKWLPLGERLGKIKIIDNSRPTAQRRPSYTVMVGQMIRRLSTVLELVEEESEEMKQDTNTIHQRRLQELLSGQEAEIKHFEVKKLKKIMVSLVILALLSAAAIG